MVAEFLSVSSARNKLADSSDSAAFPPSTSASGFVILAPAPNRFVLMPDPNVTGFVGVDTGSGFLVGVCEPKTNGVALTPDPKVGAVNLKAEKEDEEEVGVASGILKVKDGCEGVSDDVTSGLESCCDVLGFVGVCDGFNGDFLSRAATDDVTGTSSLVTLRSSSGTSSPRLTMLNTRRKFSAISAVLNRSDTFSCLPSPSLKSCACHINAHPLLPVISRSSVSSLT